MITGILNRSKAAYAFAAMMMTATAALGQSEADYPPVISDLLPAYNLSQGAFPAVLGVTLGMTFAEAEALLSPRVLDQIESTEEIFSISHPNDGRQFGFAYRTEFTTRLKTDVPQSAEYFSATLTSNLTGGRIASILRGVSYASTAPDIKPNYDSTVASIIATYGQPSIQTDRRLYYVYWNGELDRSGSETRLNQCRHVGSKRYYAFDQNRLDEYPECTALLEIELRRDVNVNKSLSEFRLEFFDYRRSYDDAVMADQYLMDGLNAAQTVGDGPSLSL